MANSPIILIDFFDNLGDHPEYHPFSAQYGALSLAQMAGRRNQS
jgi:hypothetical protein